MIKGLIFDFDGLILDTESSDLQAWKEIFSDYGVAFPQSSWNDALGGSPELFDPVQHLRAKLGEGSDLDGLRERKEDREFELLGSQPPMPGVVDTIENAIRMGLTLGVASSSRRNWVLPHLSRLALISRFHTIRCADDVSRTKPAPDLFNAALEEMGLQASEAIAFEDSPNGILAAKRAGIFCVAVPNPVTVQLSLKEADLQIGSLSDLSLEELVRKL
jgi:HAD superfamily hydrolase (TIGR01509 family)